MRASRLRPTLVAVVAVAAACSGTASDGGSEQAVRDVVQSLQSSINARDWEAFFANFSESGDLVVFDSPRTGNRAASRALMEAGWSQTPDDVRANLSVASVRLLTPEVAVADIDAEFAGSRPSHDRATAVLSRRDGAWLIDAFRIMQPAAQPDATGGVPDAVAADADHYSVELENSLLRILRVTYPPGGRSTLHGHPASCAIFIRGGTFDFTMPDGTISRGTPTEAGDVSCADREAHIPENIGGGPVELVLIELKGRDTFAP